MADEQSMTVREALGKVLGDEHADVLRDSVRMILGELMEAEVAKLAAGLGVSQQAARRPLPLPLARQA
jgi:hypothetical protein